MTRFPCARTLVSAGLLVGALLSWGASSASAQGYYPPHAGDDWTMVPTNGTVEIPVLNNDSGVDAPIVGDQIVTAPAHGSVQVLSDGRIRYTGSAGFEGTDTFTYEVWDANGQYSNTATVTVSVIFVNQPPVISTWSQTNLGGGHYVIEGYVTDDETPAGLTVTFAGLLAGRTALVQTSGYFSLGVSLSPNQMGAYSFNTIDRRGASSQTKYGMIYGGY